MVSVKTKSTLIEEINELVGAVGDKFDADEGDAERDYMAGRCPKRLVRTVRELSTLGIHLLGRIADEPVSVVRLAERAGHPKGTVSKHVQRLVEAGLVRRVPIPDNRKEFRLELTADGDTVAVIHRQMHDEQSAGIAEFLARYSSTELAFLTTVLRDLLASSRDGVRIVAPATTARR
jgi:DNA-binding MarR family transcriptional regulator